MYTLAALLALFLSFTPPDAPDPVTAFVGVHVLPMDGSGLLEDYTVVVRGTRIVDIGPSTAVDVPEGARRIDAPGKYLMPGLAEMHGHLLPPGASPEDEANLLFLYVANGITTVRVMLGWDHSLELRQKTAAGELLGPTFYMAGPSFNGNSIHSPEEAVEKVRRQKAEGWDLLKIHPGLTREEYDAMARTAHEVGIRFGGHLPAEVGLEHALAMGQETFDHLDGFIQRVQREDGSLDEDALARLVERTRAAGALVVPTMALWEYLYGTVDPSVTEAYDELKYMPPGQVRQWKESYRNRLAGGQIARADAVVVIANRMRVLQALNEGGVRILMGTDSPQLFSVPGFSLYRELERMQAAGMSNEEILRSGTYNVGEYFNGKDTFGTVAVGRRADLILLAGNPLEDLRHLRERDGVMVRGRWLPAEEIAAGLERIAASYAR